MNELSIIKDSFENWYNSKFSKDKGKVSIAINYSDMQTFKIKAFHTVRISMAAIGIKNNMSYVIPLIEVSENYNHGVTSEEEAQKNLTKKFLSEIFVYCSGK